MPAPGGPGLDEHRSVGACRGERRRLHLLPLCLEPDRRPWAGVQPRRTGGGLHEPPLCAAPGPGGLARRRGAPPGYLHRRQPALCGGSAPRLLRIRPGTPGRRAGRDGGPGPRPLPLALGGRRLRPGDPARSRPPGGALDRRGAHRRAGGRPAAPSADGPHRPRGPGPGRRLHRAPSRGALPGRAGTAPRGPGRGGREPGDSGRARRLATHLLRLAAPQYLLREGGGAAAAAHRDRPAPALAGRVHDRPAGARHRPALRHPAAGPAGFPRPGEAVRRSLLPGLLRAGLDRVLDLRGRRRVLRALPADSLPSRDLRPVAAPADRAAGGIRRDPRPRDPPAARPAQGGPALPLHPGALRPLGAARPPSRPQPPGGDPGDRRRREDPVLLGSADDRHAGADRRAHRPRGAAGGLPSDHRPQQVRRRVRAGAPSRSHRDVDPVRSRHEMGSPTLAMAEGGLPAAVPGQRGAASADTQPAGRLRKDHGGDRSSDLLRVWLRGSRAHRSRGGPSSAGPSDAGS